MSPYDHLPSYGDEEFAAAIAKADARRPASVSETQRRGQMRKVATIAISALAAMLLAGGYARYRTHDEAMATMAARRDAVPKVRVRTVMPTTNPRDLALPGTMQAFESATIYARQSGYVEARQVDIGSEVKAGDLLATIAAPEIDDQLKQARAQLLQLEAALKQAQANQDLAQVTSARTAKLVAEGWQSKQQGDTDRLNLQAQTAGLTAAEANIEAQKAQVARLEKEEGYERVVAPFDGAITSRNIDVGSLVAADTTSGTSMFSIARTNVLRVQVYVPQEAALGLGVGVTADINVPEIPGRTFTGKIARSADALQAGTRTLLVEIDIDNPDGVLASGLYCTVRFEVPRPKGTIVIPSEALIFNRDGLQVATVEDGKARIHGVQLGEDDGAQVSIASGLEPSDELIVNPPVDLVDGARVEPMEDGKAASPRTAASGALKPGG